MKDMQIWEFTAVDAVAAMRKGTLTCATYVEHLLDRVRSTADLAAFVAVDPEAVCRAAEAADRCYAAGRLAPLLGVPMAVKDNIDVAGLPAAAGTPGLASNRPKCHAVIVERLIAAGAIVMGKTNMHELAAGVTTNNAFFGTARNPYDPGRVPGGSSGGTAIAVAARLAPIGLGTDTGASNRLPAAHCGVVGFRPTIHRWPQAGLIMNSVTRDTAGPMARSVADCALMDSIVVGDEPLESVDLRGVRLGVPRADFWSALDNQVSQRAEECLDRIRAAGALLIEAEVPDVRPLSDRISTVIAMYEHPMVLARYLADAGSSVRAEEVFDRVASADVRSFLRQFRGAFSESDYREACEVHRPKLQAAYSDCFRDHALDALIFPTSPVPAPRIAEEVSMMHLGAKVSTLLISIRNTDPGSNAGIPAISLPAGLGNDGMPIGVELDGPSGSDRRLLAIAEAVERILPVTPAPQPENAMIC
jgi:mandelamide amidase